jgi:peptidoglycan/LPS O-acetylase OafA/YrhL
MMEKTRFVGLDGLRGVCALTVMLAHCEMMFRPGMIFCHGYLAVDMFFILSGFVITASYDRRLAGDLSVYQFLAARVRRLAPVYWAGLVLGVVAALLMENYHPYLSTGFSAGRIAVSGAMTALLIPHVGRDGFAYPVDPVAWTLAWEMIVNIGYALWFRKLSSRLLIACAILLWFMATANSYANPRAWSFGMTSEDIWLGGLRALPGFLMGVVLYRGYRAGLMERLPAVTPLLPIASWLVIAVMPQGLPPLFDLATVLLVCPLLLALLVRGGADAPRWFVSLGGLSYPLYASHLAWVYIARRTPLFGLEDRPDPLRAGIVVLLAVGCAWLLYRWVDPAGKRRPGDAIRNLPVLAEPGPAGITPG